MTGEAWLLVAAAVVAGYLLGRGGCGCAPARPRPGFADGLGVPVPIRVDGMIGGAELTVRGVG